MSWRQPIFRHRRWGATSIRYSGSQTVRGLILVGDVSGKGLKAAMTGALAIGALRTLAAEMVSPAMLLTRLNQQMVAQQGGFITCLCASVAADERLCLRTQGICCRIGTAKKCSWRGVCRWASVRASIRADHAGAGSGDRITLLTDGVVEAQAADELFGFERTRGLSQDSAGSIAAAAQLFGQQDDITVLTLMFVLVAELQV